MSIYSPLHFHFSPVPISPHSTMASTSPPSTLPAISALWNALDILNATTIQAKKVVFKSLLHARKTEHWSTGLKESSLVLIQPRPRIFMWVWCLCQSVSLISCSFRLSRTLNIRPLLSAQSGGWKWGKALNGFYSYRLLWTILSVFNSMKHIV